MKRFRYQEQDTAQTLGEGYQEYLEGHPDIFREETLEGDARELFYRHDLCHVLFGLDILPRDEGRADVWTLMATDVGWRRYFRYLQVPEAKEAFRMVTGKQMTALVAGFLPDMVRIFLRARRLRRKIPWDSLDSLLDRPLSQLRSDYGIRLLD